jgi:hypothetical protein
VTDEQRALVDRVQRIADRLFQQGACHEVRVYRPIPGEGGASEAEDPAYDLVLHVSFPGDMDIATVHERSEEIERALRIEVPHLVHVLIHAEPVEQHSHASLPAGNP